MEGVGRKGRRGGKGKGNILYYFSANGISLEDTEVIFYTYIRMFSCMCVHFYLLCVPVHSEYMFKQTSVALTLNHFSLRCLIDLF